MCSRCSAAVDTEMSEVLNRPKLARAILTARRQYFLWPLRNEAVWFEPITAITDCHDAKDNVYLERALVAGAETIISGDRDHLDLHPWRGVRILRPTDHLAAT